MPNPVNLWIYNLLLRFSPSVARWLFPRLTRYLGFIKRWGTVPSDNHTYIPNVQTLFHARQRTEVKQVSVATWQDLDFDEVFLQLDTCVTYLGKNALYETLRTYRSEPDLTLRFEAIEQLIEKSDIRQSVQMSLTQLKDQPASSLISLLHEDAVPVKRSRLIVFQSVLSLTTVLACFYSVFFAVALAAINFVVSLRMQQRVSRFMPGYVQLSSLLFCAYSLAEIKGGESMQYLSRLSEQRSRIFWLGQRLRLLAIDRGGGFGVVTLLFHWLNLICLLDSLIYIRGSKIIEQNQEWLLDLLTDVSSLDELNSIGNYIVAKKVICNPEFVEGNTLTLVNAYHPLLETPVANSIDIEHQSILVAGSNMAGKTTYLRTVGVNVILAQTLWFAHAESATLGRFELTTAIKRDDAILKGESYYFAELNLILKMIEKAQQSGPHLFLIDEIFRGTNTTERIAAAAAVLEVLCRTQTVLVTTHDVELLDRLGDCYVLIHFEETGNPEQPFDFKVRDGRPQGRNAIKLLDRLGYPHEIVSKANAIVAEIEALKLGSD